MVKSDLVRDMKLFTHGASFISVTELTKYLGQRNQTRVKGIYLEELKPAAGKKYFIPEVAEQIMARRTV